MATYRHSVSLDVDKCKGCTTCLGRCPTEAIRIRGGHAVIDARKCIDCGECIRRCPHKAKKADFDRYDSIPFGKKFTVALPPPSLYGQFENLDDVDYLLEGLLELGFDHVYEVARAAELATDYTRRYLKRDDIVRPVISAACPVVTRLISLRFPYLCENVMPVRPPIEIAAAEARKEVKKLHPELRDEDIFCVFISPCPAKVSYVKNGVEGLQSNVDLVVSMSEIYFKLIDVMKKVTTTVPVSRTGMIGISWASSGGEGSALMNDKYLAADGIENVIEVLDKIENGDFPCLEFIELNACNGGCVGGVMTVENPYIARVKLQNIRRYLPVSQNHAEGDDIPENYRNISTLAYAPITLDNDMERAMRMMSDIEKVAATLPGLDCGSCGAPSCRAFAEDVVRGEANYDDCIVKMRELLKTIKKEDEPHGTDGKGTV